MSGKEGGIGIAVSADGERNKTWFHHNPNNPQITALNI